MYSFRRIGSPGYALQLEKTSMTVPLLMSLLFVVWLGGRPVSHEFGDTVNYAMFYLLFSPDMEIVPSLKNEWVWAALNVLSKRADFDIHAFFTLVEAGYIFSVLWAVKKFMPSNPVLGMLFVYTSLMFFTFGTNGLRNGLACHLVLLGMAFFFEDKYWQAALVCLLAFGTHRSVMLPIASVVAARYLVPNVKYALLFWLASIAVSLIFGNSIVNFFASLGFDDRMNSYNTTDYDSDFRHTGFRWDFLLYSAMPIVMGWYVCIKRKIRDRWFETLFATYCMCNAFWVMVIRAAFSNRFAYLSWFMYPVIIAYPLVNLAVWDDQDKKTGVILLVYAGFTLFMQGYYWG